MQIMAVEAIAEGRPHPAPAQSPGPPGLEALGDHKPGLEQLGLEPHDLQRIRAILRQPLGLVLVAGPRQSGRSTTLAAMLPAVTASDAALLLDPPASWSALRGALGTIVQGRRVFACLTLERAAHVFGHFRQRGLSPAALARDLLLVLAQQRVRRLCTACREPDHSADVRNVLAQAANSWLEDTVRETFSARPGGCPRCSGTGYAGCALAYELLAVDSAVRAMAEQDAVGLDMEQALFSDGRSLWDQGLRLVARGTSSLAALRAAVREPC